MVIMTLAYKYEFMYDHWFLLAGFKEIFQRSKIKSDTNDNDNDDNGDNDKKT